MDMKTFRENLVSFLRAIGHELRTTLRVKKDQQGNDMIFPWKSDSESSLFSQFNGVIAYLEIDNRKCNVIEDSECFPSANAVSALF